MNVAYALIPEKHMLPDTKIPLSEYSYVSTIWYILPITMFQVSQFVFEFHLSIMNAVIVVFSGMFCDLPLFPIATVEPLNYPLLFLTRVDSYRFRVFQIN